MFEEGGGADATAAVLCLTQAAFREGQAPLLRGLEEESCQQEGGWRVDGVTGVTG
jgi:hypothetical protein